jgi:hypothetical protein
VAVADASKLTYDPSTLRQALSTATASAAIQDGAPQTQLVNISTLDFGFYCLTANCFGSNGDIKSLSLRSDGTVAGVTYNSDYSIASTQTLATGAVGLFQIDDSAVIRFSDGSASVLGLNAYGELGVGDQLPRAAPTKVTSLNGITSAAGGDRHAIARLADGSVVVSGDNSQQQLGVQSTGLPSSKVFVKVNGIGLATAVAATLYSSYAVMSDGSVMAWGGDYKGSLGNGIPSSLPQLPKPVLVTSNSQLGSVISLEASNSGVAALRSDGSVFGWGYGASGIIPGATSDTLFAKAILGLPLISKISSDSLSYYALSREGAVLVWGNGYSTVTQIPGLPKIVDLTRTSFATVAWAADGRRFIILGTKFYIFPS